MEMDRKQAIEEVNFIKKLLDDTGKEIGKSGWAFIILGIVFMLSTFTLLFTGWIRGGAIRIIAGVLLNLGVWAVSYFIYHKYVLFKDSTTLEKQVWQVWLWAIFITVILRSMEIIIPITLDVKSGVTISIIRFDDYLLLLSLIITGVLTNRKYFYKLGMIVFIIAISLIVVNHSVFNSQNNILLQFYSCTLFINSLLPFFGTGIYFLSRQAKAPTHLGGTNGTEQPSGSI